MPKYQTSEISLKTSELATLIAITVPSITGEAVADT